MMKYNSWSILTSTFKILCIVATVATIAVWIYNYTLDLDLCLVDFKYYANTKDSIPPVLSVCFSDPFEKDKLKEYGVNQSMYLSYLNGDFEDPNMKNVNYDNISLNLMDYSGPYYVGWHNGSLIKYQFSNAN